MEQTKEALINADLSKHMWNLSVAAWTVAFS
jgi:hypothetical protein